MLPSMKGNYFDPDTNPRVDGAYDPCPDGVLLTFDPPEGAKTHGRITFIGSSGEIEFVLKVTNPAGPNTVRILSKQEVQQPAISNFFTRVHLQTDVVEGDVTVTAETKVENGRDVKHIYID